MSTATDEQPIVNIDSSNDGNNEITDLEARKMNDTTFDTEDESDDQRSEGDENENHDDDLELDVRDAAVDILDQLVELFIEKNGREPNEEEVMQWIDVFKSLKIEDADEQTENESPTDEITSNPSAE